LRNALRDASGAGVADVHVDLAVMVSRTRAFRAAVVDLQALARPDPAMAQTGYSFIHPTRALITYNLLEPGMERLRGPSRPFARAMLGARTIHEWAHLAVDSGWVPCTLAPADMNARVGALDALLAGVIPPVRHGEQQGGLHTSDTPLAHLTLPACPTFKRIFSHNAS
jgi:hypothetical protein